MKLIIMNRNQTQEGMILEFKVLFKCSVCKKEVEPEKLIIGRAHIYALHCDLMQDIGVVSWRFEDAPAPHGERGLDDSNREEAHPE